MLAVPGAELFTMSVGVGEPVVVLHGGPGASHDYLRPQCDRFAESGHSLFYYDQRGGGRSKSVRPGTVDDHIADLERVRAHLGEEQLTLLGYSWGGLLSILYALRHPARVKRMLLLAPAPLWAGARDEMKARMKALGDRPEVAALRASLDMTDRKNRFALAVSSYFVDPRRALELTPFLVQGRAESAVWDSLGEYDLRDDVRALTMPIMILHGEEDPIPIASSRLLAERTGATLVALPHCGHVPYIEGAAQTFVRGIEFLSH
jgi:proline iminopeptidase